MDKCKVCGSEIQATVKVYLSNVVLDDEGNITSYDVARHLADTPDGFVFDDARVYCREDHEVEWTGVQVEPRSPLPDPPPELADAWRRYQKGEHVAGFELSKLDEWRDDCARDAGF
jgi:hypothetical protein